MRNYLFSLLLLICAGSFSKLASQITSTSGAVHACAPANVTFTAPPGATSISWNFGQFGNSNNATGSFNVTTPGSFVATFNGVVGGNNFTFTVPVTVHPKPTANFSIAQPASNCSVKTITLTDQSSGTSPLTAWLWVYGDGNSGSQSGVHTHGYSLAGSYSVTLKVTDSFGCDHQVTKGTVVVAASPVAVISSTPPALYSCISPFTANFTAANSTGTGLSYNWNFGNSQTSTQVSSGPITYNTQSAPYVVSLTVTSTGCSSSTSVSVIVSTPSIAVTFPTLVCKNAVPAVTLQTNQPVVSFSLGNGGTSTALVPSASTQTVYIPSYSVAGVYNVTISAGSGQCTTTPVVKTLTVQQVVASFTASQPFASCQPSFTAQYTNLSSSNATQFIWSYPDQNNVVTTSTLTNPVFTFSLSKYSLYARPTPSYNPVVTLIAISAAGCSATATDSLHSIQRSSPWFTKNKREGCAPLVVTFRDSTHFYPPFPITSYTWVSNLGSPSVTAIGTASASPPYIPPHTFTYSTPGLYRPYLLVTTANGCTEMSFIDTVVVANPPPLSFSFSPAQVCPGQAVQIINTTTTSGIQHWHVDSDNGFFSGCVSQPAPSWQFTHVGLHTFTLSGYKSSCKNSVVSTQSVQVKGPIVRGRYETNCTNRLVVDFHASLQQVQTGTISFGDQTSATFTSNPSAISAFSVVHTYTATGDYTVSITGVNAITGCAASSHSMVVNVRNITADFLAPGVACANVSAAFNATTAVDVFTTCSRGYAWYYDNLPPVETTVPFGSHMFTSPGIHTVSLFVKDINSCTDKLTKTLTVSDANPSFVLNTNTVCLSTGTIQIINTTPQVPDPIVSYVWSFGDGSALTTTSQAVPVKTYTSASVPFSIYDVSLTAINSQGCARTVGQQVKVIKPDAGFTASPNSMCLTAGTPTTITFIAQTAHPSYTFYYGAGATATQVVTFSISSYTFMPGNYTVSMKVRDADGCYNTGTTTIDALQIPVADFVFSSPGAKPGVNSICAPAIVSYTNASLPFNYFPTWQLKPGGPYISQQTVTDAYTTPTVIPISMTVTTGFPLYCSSSVTKNFTVFVAKAEPVVSKTLVCLGDKVNFSVDTTNGGGVHGWVWDFGDFSPSDTLIATSVPAPPKVVTHAYNNYTATAAGNASVSLIYWTSGKICTYYASKPVRLVNVESGFVRNSELIKPDTAHCLRLPDRFASRSESNEVSPLSFEWRIEGSQYSDTAVVHTFSAAGVHQVTLITRGVSNGCADTAVKKMTIFPLPTATVASADNCPGKPFTLTVTTSPGVVSGTWTPVENLVGSPVFSAFSTTVLSTGIATASTVFSLVVSDTNACASDIITGNIKILEPPPTERWDTVVVVGEPIPINAYVGNFTYSWTPVTTSLNCVTCYSPVSTTTNDITYTVVVEDHLGCAKVSNTYSIMVLPKSSVDVPTAFTPNGDGINDVIYVGGWGIKKLNYFRVFNRWGQLLFESNDISQGWDGTWRGVPQNVETYVYQVSVDTYIDSKPLTKSSTFKLLR
jgi:gliding motility-associated-like protein